MRSPRRLPRQQLPSRAKSPSLPSAATGQASSAENAQHFPRLPPHEVDRDRNSLQLEALAELVLDPVAVVARHQTGIVDEEAEARRPGANLRPVEQVQPSPVPGRRLARLAQLGEEAVQLGGWDPPRVLLELLLDPVEETVDPAAGL